MSAAFLRALRGQRRAVQVSRPRLQSRQPVADDRDPGSGRILVLTSLREPRVKTGIRLVCHPRYAVFQVAGAAMQRAVFAGVLDLINGLRGPPYRAASS